MEWAVSDVSAVDAGGLLALVNLDDAAAQHFYQSQSSPLQLPPPQVSALDQGALSLSRVAEPSGRLSGAERSRTSRARKKEAEEELFARLERNVAELARVAASLENTAAPILNAMEQVSRCVPNCMAIQAAAEELATARAPTAVHDELVARLAAVLAAVEEKQQEKQQAFCKRPNRHAVGRIGLIPYSFRRRARDSSSRCAR